MVLYYNDDNISHHSFDCHTLENKLILNNRIVDYSTVTLFARFRGWSTLQPRITAM